MIDTVFQDPKPERVLEELINPSPQPSKSSDMVKEIEELKNKIKELKEDLKYERRFRIKAERELRDWKGNEIYLYHSNCFQFLTTFLNSSMNCHS